MYGSHPCFGYLSLCQSGFMHGGINAGNILLAEDQNSKLTARASDIKGQVVDMQRSDVGIVPNLGHLNLEESPSFTDIAGQTKELVAKLNVGTDCYAFIAGDDTAIKWSDHLANDRDRGTQLGTEQFMALDRQRAMIRGRDYLHSPVDDIESFFWLAFWAILFHGHHQQRTEDDIFWQEMIAKGDYLSKCVLIGELRIAPSRPSDYSSFTAGFLPLLKKWSLIQDALSLDWIAVPKCRPQDQDKFQRAQYNLYHFHLFALRGARDVLLLLAEHYNKLDKPQ
ncbi:hypothetical protein DFH06DRAFT_1255604 [Mycena polygramma]|nr:hypothetical protein DFH06DRAFT_1255604 [Mycena polygramma]